MDMVIVYFWVSWQNRTVTPMKIANVIFLVLKNTSRGHNTVNCSYTGLSVIPNSHIPDPENFNPAQKQLTVCFVQSGYSDIPASKS